MPAFNWVKGIIGFIVGLSIGLFLAGFLIFPLLLGAALAGAVFGLPGFGTVLFGGFILWEAVWGLLFFYLFSGMGRGS